MLHRSNILAPRATYCTSCGEYFHMKRTKCKAMCPDFKLGEYVIGTFVDELDTETNKNKEYFVPDEYRKEDAAVMLTLLSATDKKKIYEILRGYYAE